MFAQDALWSSQICKSQFLALTHARRTRVSFCLAHRTRLLFNCLVIIVWLSQGILRAARTYLSGPSYALTFAIRIRLFLCSPKKEISPPLRTNNDLNNKLFSVSDETNFFPACGMCAPTKNFHAQTRILEHIYGKRTAAATAHILFIRQSIRRRRRRKKKMREKIVFKQTNGMHFFSLSLSGSFSLALFPFLSFFVFLCLLSISTVNCVFNCSLWLWCVPVCGAMVAWKCKHCIRDCPSHHQTNAPLLSPSDSVRCSRSCPHTLIPCARYRRYLMESQTIIIIFAGARARSRCCFYFSC